MSAEEVKQPSVNWTSDSETWYVETESHWKEEELSTKETRSEERRLLKK